MPANHKRAVSSGIDVPEHNGFWSYFSSSSSSSNISQSSTPSSATRNRAASSASLPKHSRTPFEIAEDNGINPTTADNVAYSEKNVLMNHGQRARFIKFGGVITFVILLFWFFAPGDHGPATYPSGPPPPVNNEQNSNLPPETLPDGVKCLRSHDGKKPIMQYALMVDAGSTGSRIHVYRFNNCGPTPELEDEVFKMTPVRNEGAGLSSYKEDAEGAAKSLDILMDTAVKHVPEEYRSCTPVAVKATAGLRKLGPELSDRILRAVRTRLEMVYPFPVLSEAKGGVEVMDGKDEGVYAWITANYLLGKIGGADLTPTAAVFDLGGGSTQIVFEPNFRRKGGGMPDKLADGDHKYEMDFGGRKFSLYQHSYLGYGLMAARENLHKAVVESLYEQHKSDATLEWLEKPITNPCIAPGMNRTVTIELGSSHPLGKSVKVKMVGPREGAPAQCRALAEATLKKEAECKISPCAFNGVHQPPLDKVFATEDIYLFSYFYDRTKPLGMPESFTLRELKDLASRVCQGSSAWGIFQGIDGAMKELTGRPEHCLDLNFMLALLHTGYGMPLDREVRIAKKIRDNELGWCLGASLPLLSQESGWSCRIKEVSS